MTIASIIIPFFNQIRYLDQSLRSALTQTIGDVEVILVNDGSTEDPSPIVSCINDPRIKVINQANAGVALARNTGIKAAQGEFLAFLDADDWLAPTMIETLVSMLQRSSDVALGYCDITHVDSAGKMTDMYSVAASRAQLSGNILPALIVGGYFPPVSVLVKATVMEQVGGFDPKLGGCCDWDLWIRIATAGYKALFSNNRLAYYRLHDESMSKNQQHMQDAALATLIKNMSTHPTQMARSIHALIESCSTVWSQNVEAAKRIRELEQTIANLKPAVN
jgi:glycosyltransferase involved in cell wall biosynthesis